ncbi:OmpA family protein [Pararobbsia alpina]|uniref:Peptidoglycan-associated lipoprotein n=1 Tax=Pararobbsia alpina TaxID=621374 RepID=A0A6S7C529_9BURK|nr:OmpA family protein [Pararobbsia alpina]CAB3781377.1 Peptidoglycan-associated lipoprotein [Pararobbsia alpina]
MGNTLSRTLIAVTASVVLAACSQWGNPEPSVATARPATPKDPWEAVKAELAPTGTSSGIALASASDGSLKANLQGDASFDKGSSAIKAAAQPSLYQLSQTMSRHPELHARLVGYSDNSGDADFNVALSKNRARSVAEYLTAHGVEDSRIAVEGRGAADPVDDNSSSAGRARNRRVEIFLTM